MQHRSFLKAALDDVMAKKLILIAIPTDAAPYGFVGTDLKPQGLDVDVVELIGVKVELVPVTSANRIPYLQTKKTDLVVSTLGKNPDRKKVIDITIAYSPFFQAILGPKALVVKTPADLAGKSIGVTRGAMEDQEVGKIAPAGVDIKRFEDMNGTVSACAAGQVQLMDVGASVAGNFMAKNPQISTEYKPAGIVRAGIATTPRGQIEAAQSLALSEMQVFTRVVLPPSLKRVWPALVSQIIIVMLGSAVRGQISTPELSHAANLIQSNNFRAFEAFIIATLICLTLSVALRQLLNWAGPKFIFGK